MIHIKRFAMGAGVLATGGLVSYLIVIAIDNNPIPLFVIIGSVIAYAIGYSIAEGVR